MMFWTKKKPEKVFFVSGKQLQPQFFGDMAVDVACKAYPEFIQKLEKYSDTTLVQGKSLFQLVVNHRRTHLKFHFHALITSIFFAFAREVSKCPEEIYMRVAAGIVFGLRDKAGITTDKELTDDELGALSAQIGKYASLVFSEADEAYNPASKLFANCIFSAACDDIAEDENFSLVELVILPKLINADLEECLEAIKNLDVRYVELNT